ncbi:MAG: 50S ribosomal protein L25 [Armatimonadetes bacterium]|nr:50S ribosomal protein L25 [Armatimonadota bacterium]
MPTLQVEPRDKSKSAAVNRMRKDGVMPMAILTKKTGTQMVSADREEIKTMLDSIVGLPIFDVDGAAKTKVILKEVQRDAVSRKIIHMTVQEVADSDVIKVSIPVKVSGTPQAVAKRQSTLMVPMNALDVQAKVSDLPAEIAVDASNMTENDRIIVSDLSGYEAITFLTSPETVLATTKQLRGMGSSSAAGAEGEEGEEGAEGEGGEEAAAEAGE